MLNREKIYICFETIPKKYDENYKVAEVAPIDYSKLTQIDDVDQYKVVSVTNTIIADDGNGNISQFTNKQINHNKETEELDDILQNVLFFIFIYFIYIHFF